ncbi:MAG TPA: TMEM175 family protein [Caldimonas sp.]|nr:TMEM175 family protein [Caldimonas sp.]HEX4235802.1 TMEM175 family protein [Caldimonas sp.]
MEKGRLEAFSDGVFAVNITILVLELKAPHSDRIEALLPIVPAFLSYVLSFLYIGIYWNNHHHMLRAAGRISGTVLWANLLLLFWLSLFPFATAWMGENHFGATPTALYGVVLLMAALSYSLLQYTIIVAEGPSSFLKMVLGADWKGKASPVLYLIGIAAAFYAPRIAQAIYLGVALMWLVPDRRIESALARKRPQAQSSG